MYNLTPEEITTVEGKSKNLIYSFHKFNSVNNCQAKKNRTQIEI